MAKIESTQFESIEFRQWCSLKHQLEYAKIHSPFYKKRFAEISLEAINSIEDFQKTPVTTKNDLNANNAEFLAIPDHQVIDYVTTSGTLGTPISFALNECDLQRLALNEKNSFKMVGITPQDKVQVTTTLDRRFMAGMAYFLGLRALGAGCIRVGSGLPALQWDSIKRFQPTAIVGVPSFLLKLAQFAKENDINLEETSVKKAICIGEPLRDENQQLNALGKSITALWNIDLFSTYASTEISTAYTECEHHNGNHEQADLIFSEILDDKGKPVKQGDVGELVVTPLGTKTMPLVRFATGDMVKEVEGICSCGRQTKRLSSVIGRKQQLLKVKGTSLYPQQCFEVLDAIKTLNTYVVSVHSSASGTDELSIIIPTDVSEAQKIHIQEMLQSHLRISPEIIKKPTSENQRITVFKKPT